MNPSRIVVGYLRATHQPASSLPKISSPRTSLYHLHVFKMIISLMLHAIKTQGSIIAVNYQHGKG
jgi:hypothetical protein